MNRGLMIFLGGAAALVLLNPLFWQIVAMNFGAANYELVEADGAVRNAVQGPKGPWPDWAPSPGAAAVKPAVSYSAAPGYPAQGFGDTSIDGAPSAAVAAMKARLEESGWTVMTSRLDSVEPTLPPRKIVLCTLTARREAPDQTLIYVFQFEPEKRGVRVHWIDGSPLAEAIASDC